MYFEERRANLLNFTEVLCSMNLEQGSMACEAWDGNKVFKIIENVHRN